MLMIFFEFADVGCVWVSRIPIARLFIRGFLYSPYYSLLGDTNDVNHLYP